MPVMQVDRYDEKEEDAEVSVFESNYNQGLMKGKEKKFAEYSSLSSLLPHLKNALIEKFTQTEKVMVESSSETDHMFNEASSQTESMSMESEKPHMKSKESQTIHNVLVAGYLEFDQLDTSASASKRETCLSIVNNSVLREDNTTSPPMCLRRGSLPIFNGSQIPASIIQWSQWLSSFVDTESESISTIQGLCQKCVKGINPPKDQLADTQTTTSNLSISLHLSSYLYFLWLCLLLWQNLTKILQQ